MEEDAFREAARGIDRAGLSRTTPAEAVGWAAQRGAGSNEARERE